MKNSSLALVALLLMALALGGCKYVKKGGTAFQIPEKSPEYTRGELRPPKNELAPQRVIKLKWYDTNTFMTTATLAPGTYTFIARNYEGGHYSADVKVDGETKFYELPPRERVQHEREQAEGPEITGRIATLVNGRPARNLSILFIGDEIVLKSANADPRGNFKTNAPQPGIWRIEVHALGSPPVSYAREPQMIQAATDLGPIPLR